MTNRIKNQPWLSLADQVLATCGCVDYTPKEDATTTEIIERCIRKLMTKNPLSAAIAAAFVHNIKYRVNGQFEWSGEIKLTKDQYVAGLKSHPQFAQPGRTRSGVANDFSNRLHAAENEIDELRAELQMVRKDFADVLAAIKGGQLVTTSSLPDSYLIPTSLLPHSYQTDEIAVAGLGFSPLMRSNEKRRDHGNMTSAIAAHEVGFASCLHEQEMASPSHEDVVAFSSSVVPFPKPISMDHSGGLRSTHPFPNTFITNESSAATTPPAKNATTDRKEISLWVKDGGQAISGRFELGDEKHSLVFTNFDHGFERIREAALSSCADYLSDFNQANGRALAGLGDQPVVSGLYGDKDSYARKEPSSEGFFVLLVRDQGKLVAVQLHAEGSMVEYPLKACTGQKAGSPTYKASVT